MAAVQALVVDEEKIKKAVVLGVPLIITTYTLPHEVEVYIEQVLTFFLGLSGQAHLKDYLLYCVQELAVNAKKANTKRVYFQELGLDLNNPEQYEKGMSQFKEATISNIPHFLSLQKEQGLYVKLILQAKHQTILLEVRNNVVITKTELVRIYDKMARSRQYKNLEDALSQVLDDAEGAGLGLVILVLMLKKIGLDGNCLDIHATKSETIARIEVPMDKVRLENMAELSKAIVAQVDSLPQFPENILTIQNLIGKPEVQIATIARHISMDPALTADLLKIVNSAQYMLPKRVDSIVEAVKMVGIRGLKNLLYSYGTQKILGDDTEGKRALWEHSYKTAFYAYNLVKNLKKSMSLLDDAYVGGILHDIGKIVFASPEADMFKQIKAFCSERNLPVKLFEDVSTGISHAEIGALIAEKWNFPQTFVDVIRYHHDPIAASVTNKDLVDTVYLANMFCEYEDGNLSFEQFDPVILEGFGITSKKQADSLLEKFAQGFIEENQKTNEEEHSLDGQI